MNDFQSYGFTNVTGQACTPMLSVVFCTEDTLVADGAENVSVCRRDSTPRRRRTPASAGGHRGKIAAPGQVSMLGEVAMKAGEEHTSAVRSSCSAARDADREVDSVRGFADVHFSNIDSSRPRGRRNTTSARSPSRRRRLPHERVVGWGGAVSFSRSASTSARPTSTAPRATARCTRTSTSRTASSPPPRRPATTASTSTATSSSARWTASDRQHRRRAPGALDRRPAGVGQRRFQARPVRRRHLAADRGRRSSRRTPATPPR